VCGIDHVSRRHDTLVGGDPAGLAVFDGTRAGALEQLSTVAAHGVREPEQVFARVELRLVVEADRASDLEGQRAFAREARGQPEPPCHLHLSLDLDQLLAGAAVDVGGLALQVALDTELFGEPDDLSEAGLVRRPVRPGPVRAEALLERVIDQAVLRGDLRGRAPGDLSAHLQRLEHRDTAAGAL
jgi:hypothetical protein